MSIASSPALYPLHWVTFPQYVPPSTAIIKVASALGSQHQLVLMTNRPHNLETQGTHMCMMPGPSLAPTKLQSIPHLVRACGLEAPLLSCFDTVCCLMVSISVIYFAGDFGDSRCLGCFVRLARGFSLDCTFSCFSFLFAISIISDRF